MFNMQRFLMFFFTILLLFSGNVLAIPTVSWSSVAAVESTAKNIPLGGITSLLTILALFISGRYIFPYIKNNRMKSFFITALLSTIFAISSSGHFLSDLEAGGSSTLIISTSQGIRNLGTQADRTIFDTTIRNDYLETVLLKFNPDHCVLGGTCSDGAMPTGNSCVATLDCSCTTISFDSSPIPKAVKSSVAAASNDLYIRFQDHGFDNKALNTSATTELNKRLFDRYGTNDYLVVTERWKMNPTDTTLIEGDWGFGHAAYTLAYLEILKARGAPQREIQAEADKQVERWYAREAQARCNSGVENWLNPQKWSEDSRLDYWTPRVFVEWYIGNRLNTPTTLN